MVAMNGIALQSREPGVPTVTIQLTSARDADVIQGDGHARTSRSDGVPAGGEGARMSKQVQTLEEVEATLRAISNAVTGLQMIVACQLEQERAGADDFPLAIYEEAVAAGALPNDYALDAVEAAAWREREEDDRDESEVVW